jgi:hypothetical protein
MKTGIYLDGLGQSVVRESVTKYAERLTNEYRHHSHNEYSTKVEKISFGEDSESTVVSILEKNGTGETVIYKFYELKYNEILTSKFSKRNILVKNLMLLSVVFKKFPIFIKRMFSGGGYNRPYQMSYVFLMFLIIALSVILMIPAVSTMIMDTAFGKKELTGKITSSFFIDFLHNHKYLTFYIPPEKLLSFFKIFMPLIALVILIAPHANSIINNLATEFVCAHFYLEHGEQKQLIHGKIDQLVEYIAEQDKDSKIHFHAYSFGSLIALDYLFAFGNTPTGNVIENTEALITIGTPFDFINAYYPKYYADRSDAVEKNLKWINIYSIADAMGSNFRSDAKIGESKRGIRKNGLKPINVSYEVVRLNKFSIVHFIFLTSIKVHGMYWPEETDGQSCLKPIYIKMKDEELI